MKNAKLQALATLIVADDSISLPQGFKIKAVNTSKETDQTFIREVGQLRYKVWLDQGMDMSNSKGADSQSAEWLNNAHQREPKFISIKAGLCRFSHLNQTNLTQ
ncbi:MAG: hypothetical protein MJK04_05010, partial [Psychrosphaera sp.]|nr:hypothetical protein [Psychrosphaera sp.]